MLEHIYMQFTIDRYWGLMGESENADEFMLIARLCDEVIINYEEGILELGLRK